MQKIFTVPVRTVEHEGLYVVILKKFVFLANILRKTQSAMRSYAAI